ARQAIERLAEAPPLRAPALATLARVLLGQGRPAEARAEAQAAYDLLLEQGRLEEGESLIRLVYAEALAASEEHERARAVVTEAERRLLERAAQISDERWQRSFLEAVPENAQTLATAARLCNRG